MASKLHDGSSWEGNSVVEDDGTLLRVRKIEDGSVCLDMEYEAIWIEDALAVIRRAKLDPLAIAAMELVEHLDAIENHHWSGDDEADITDMDSAESRTDELLRRIRELLP